MAMAASTSSAVDSNNNYSYDVFISHRGPDTKRNFASHLYRRLISYGQRVFLDYQEMQEGEGLSRHIQETIRTAALHVAIFSPRYASSKLCLDELLLMLESGAPIIPVFCGVKPAELRWTRVNPKLKWTRVQNGVYVQAIHSLEKKGTYDSTTIEQWRNALLRVADMSGLDLAAFNGDEGELLHKVVEVVLKKFPKPDINLARYPTGLEDKVEDFERTVLLQQHSRRVQVVGITGLGGVGKTTLAKEFFNRKRSNYNKSCFLFDVRENARKSLHSLQSKLLKGLLQLDMQIDNMDQGIEILKKHLSSHQVLLVLDDVDDVYQVDALLTLDVLRHDSLILITSRDANILARSGVQESSIYKLTGLNREHSIELFCSHAFCQPHPLSGFEYLVNKFIKVCDGLPLSLKVVGALLYENTNKSWWEEELERLEQIHPDEIPDEIHDEIQQKLQISYETLGTQEKQVFLDIACFFIGRRRDTAIRIWDGSGWAAPLVFRNLENKSLVQVDNANRIRMHDRLRDLGRHIAQRSFPYRFWCWTKDVSNNFCNQTSEFTSEFGDGIAVRGIRVLPGEYKDNDNKLTSYQMRRLQLLDSEDGLLKRIVESVELPNLLWLRWNKCPSSSLSSWIPMKNLRVLEVRGNELKTLWQSKSQVPLNLRELMITAPLSKISKTIGELQHLERIYFNLRGKNNVKTIPEEFCNLRSLMGLELLWCREMKSLPYSFGNLINLQHIDLSRSVKLVGLPNSFGNLTRLKYLNLYKCINLTISRETLGHINTLEYIDLRFCKKIEVLPPQIADQRSLENLYLGGTNLKELPRAIGYLSNLEVLELGSPLLKALPSSLGDLRNLKELKLLKCQELKCLPDSVGLLIQLSKLSIYDCPLRELPFEGGTETLTESSLSNLDSSIDMCMFGLQHLTVSCTKISEVSFAKGVCPNLRSLYIEDCDHLVDVGSLPNRLIKLRLINCSNLRNIGLCDLAQLQTLSIGNCEVVEELHIEKLVSLEELWAYECVELKCIQGLAQLTRLRLLDVTQCSNLKELPGIEHSMSLEMLHASQCPILQWGEGVVENLRQRLKEFLYMENCCFLNLYSSELDHNQL